MNRPSLTIAQLYPLEMNIYGDNGNLEVLQQRASLYGIDVKITTYKPGDDVKKTLLKADILIGGGGQDSGQSLILTDLQKIAAEIRAAAVDGRPMLMICGLYQLFGHYFRTLSGAEMAGIAVFDATTVAGRQRLIGNITLEIDFGQVVGYENHSGLTTLLDGQAPFGRVLSGAGNNGHDSTEGARVYNVFGSYLHGPILPKNPRLADELISLATAQKYGQPNLQPVDEAAASYLKKLNQITDQARAVAMNRPR
jgi:CobQ-like glutamine amidotransferase family enzyme